MEIEKNLLNAEALNDADLDEVAGGGFGSFRNCTLMKCSCGFNTLWKGDFSGSFSGQSFDCPNCGGKGTLIGQ